MSEKKRQKKDGERKDKKNKAMRESEDARKQEATAQAGDDANVTETEPGVDKSQRERGK